MSTTDRPPGPSGLPALGSVPTYLRDPFGAMERWADEYGDVVAVRFPGSPTVQVTDPNLVQQVLVADADSYERGDVARRVFGDLEPESLSVAEGEQWRRQRRLVQPAFGRERVAGYAPFVTRYADELAREWEDGDHLHVREEMSRLTLRVLARALFDLDVGETDDDAIREAVDALLAKADYSSVSAFVPDWIPTPTNRRFARAAATLHDRIETTMAVREAETGSGADPGDDLLSRLLAAGEDGGLSDAEVRDNAVALLLAGHDTTAVALTYAWYALARNSDAERRLHDELDDALGDRLPEPADLDDLPVLDRVVRETLRLYPPTPAITRQTTETVELGDYRLPEGTTVLLPQWVVHRDPRHYDDPAAFRPDRWRDDGPASDRPEYAYFPFGGGPRHCVGMRFAAMELRLALATMARRVRPDLARDDPIEFTMSVSLRPKRPVEMVVRTR